LMVIITPTVMLLGTIILAVSWFAPLASMLGGLLSFVGDNTINLLKLLDTLPQLNTPPLSWRGVVVAYGVFFIVVLRREILQRSSSFVRESQ
jgi:hypothetical protein